MPNLRILALFVGGLCICVETAIINHDPAAEDKDLIEEEDMLLGEEPLEERNAMKYDSKLWPDKTVIYHIDGLRLFSKRIKKIMKYIEDNTCIKFKERKDEKGYVRIYNGKAFTCFADAGYFPIAQRLSLGLGCRKYGAILHELVHVLGFYHEHQRPDRDDYVTVYEQNLKKGAATEYEKKDADKVRVYGPFDYDSVMIYGETDASKSPSHLKTMTAKTPGVTLKNAALKKGLTALDIKKINSLYDCPGKDKFSPS